MNILSESTTIRKVTLCLTEEDIREILIERGVLPSDVSCEIFVQVPGGGDWSNTALDIDSSTPVRIFYEITTTER